MSFADVLFPVNLGPLTYRCPDNAAGRLQPGMIVSAPLRGHLTKGIVLSLHDSPPQGNIKEIAEIQGDGPAVGEDLLGLISWMAEYYIAPHGIILKQTLPAELFTKTRERKTKTDTGVPAAAAHTPADSRDVAAILKTAAAGRYATLLVQAPSTFYEYALAAAAVAGAKNVLVILPGILQADRLFSLLDQQTRERACILHSGVRRGKRSSYVDGIVAGRYDIVIGTRAALFAPMRVVSLIMVLQEHSAAYKLEDGVRYNVRDAAVMRGFLTKAAVVLSSVTPSIDSCHNAQTGKYHSLKPAAEPGPRVRVVDMRYERRDRKRISKAVFESARARIAAGRRMMFYINRRGYAVLRCSECGHTEECSRCRLPLIYHKEERGMRCHACGVSTGVPEFCSRCRSVAVELAGAGTERVQEEIEGLFGVESVRFDSDRVKRRSGLADLLQADASGSRQVVVGTRMLTKRTVAERPFAAAAVLNIDQAFCLPDFRASEKVYAELAALRDCIEPAGELIIQTRLPALPLFRHFREGTYTAFVVEELDMRRQLGYPPYRRLLSITVARDAALAEKIVQFARGLGNAVEVLGPSVTRGREGSMVCVILLKSVDRKELNTAARAILAAFPAARGAGISVDVDPG